MIGQTYCGKSCRDKAARKRARERDPNRTAPHVAKDRTWHMVLERPTLAQLTALEQAYEAAITLGSPNELFTLITGALPEGWEQLGLNGDIGELSPQRWQYYLFPPVKIEPTVQRNPQDIIKKFSQPID